MGKEGRGMKDKFEVGDRVALRHCSNWGPSSYRESSVEKVYANGNFLLKGSKQQYRPEGRSPYDKILTARPAGARRWDGDDVIFWDELAEKEIKEARAQQRKRNDLHKIKSAVDQLRHETASQALIAALLGALSKFGPEPPSSE
jgi:hypothetical protein